MGRSPGLLFRLPPRCTRSRASSGPHVEGLAEIGEQPCFRAMDWLHEVTNEVEKKGDEVANLFNIELDLLVLRHHQNLLRAGGGGPAR